jgi:DNA-directed RNA polymerase specialized sigma24 family protein
MNSQHRVIRGLLTTMAPKRAIEYVRAFELPKEEELCLILADIRGLSLVEVSMERNCSVETVKRARKRAYSKIADAINNETPTR